MICRSTYKQETFFCILQNLQAIFVISLLIILISPEMTSAQPLEESCLQDSGMDKSAEKVSFPSIPARLPGISPTPGANSTNATLPPKPSPAKATMPETNTLSVSRMTGQVHFKHLQDQRLAPSRALSIRTGPGASWAEFKINNNFTGRIAFDSEVLVFPDTGVCFLKKGSLIVRVSGTSGTRYSVMAGHYVCRIHGTTLRVQRTERQCDFQVLEGEIIVYNRLSGEVYRASHVNRPVN